jgi:hypothetical protein
MYCILPIQAKKLWSSLGLEEFQHRWSRGERLNSIGDAPIIGEQSNQLCALLSFLPPPPFPSFGRLVQPSGLFVWSFTQGIELCFLHKWKTKLVLVGAGSGVHWCFYLYEEMRFMNFAKHENCGGVDIWWLDREYPTKMGGTAGLF